MFRFLLSKKGFTLTEIFTVTIVIAILAAVAVPIFSSSVKKQHQNECKNNRTIISTAFEQVMYGMVDNGKKQETLRDGNENVIRYALNFDGAVPQGDHKDTYPAVAIKDDKNIGVEDNKYVGKACFVLCYASKQANENKPTVAGVVPFTIGDIRGGYRDIANVPEYTDGCANGNYLKKEALKDKPFYEILDNQEIPVCPFADFSDTDTTNDYYYHILWDTDTDSIKVLCSCPECNTAD